MLFRFRLASPLMAEIFWQLPFWWSFLWKYTQQFASMLGSQFLKVHYFCVPSNLTFKSIPSSWSTTINSIAQFIYNQMTLICHIFYLIKWYTFDILCSKTIDKSMSTVRRWIGLMSRKIAPDRNISICSIRRSY